MFHHHGKKPVKVKALTELTRMMSTSQWLSDDKRHALWTAIHGCIGLESSRWCTHYESLLGHFIDDCQGLPETANRYYSNVGGLIDHALNRTEAALELFKNFVIKDEQGALSEEQLLWQYALFTAALLQGVGKLYLDYQVEVYNQSGQFITNWSPLTDKLSLLGSHYYFQFEGQGSELFRRRLNVLMAKKLMPAVGFNWIASNADVLDIWLALLNEDMASAGTLGAILIRADAMALSRYYNDALIRLTAIGGRTRRVGTFVDSVPESLADKEMQTGMAFIKWLEGGLKDGIIMINKAPLLMVPGGMLMCADMFKLFVREHPEFKNWLAIQKAFLSLGLHKKMDSGIDALTFEEKRTHQHHEGVVFTDFAMVLPEKAVVLDMTSGGAMSLTAMEIIVQSLDNNGFSVVSEITKTVLTCLSREGLWTDMGGKFSPQVGMNQRG